MTTALVRTRARVGVDLGRYILESPRITRLPVDEDCFSTAWNKFRAFATSR